MTIMISESNVNGKEKAIEILDPSETETLLSEHAPSNDEWTRPNNLSFPWPLIDLFINFKEVFQTKSNLFKRLLHSFYLQLLISFIICILCIVFGVPRGPYYYGYRMSHIVFFVQGICGLLCILLHMCASVSSLMRFLATKLPCDERLIKRSLITSAHMLTVFLIFWFFLGHIWFIGEIISKDVYYAQTMRIFTMVMVPIQYVVGAWLLYCCIWNNSRVLVRPDQSPNKNGCLDAKETAIFASTNI